MNRYPIQLAKVQRPALRDETLARDRLLDWLAAKIHDRVVLVLADAGYGKTTLLADFAGRTRLRTLWYRLEDDDRDWISFLNHLVAAGREHDPNFAPTTAAMLSDMSVTTPTREAAIDVFLRELPSIAEHGAILILDDFHLVDENADIRIVVRELVLRAPERMSIVFASRRRPAIPLARLRAAGEVAELNTDDLRFDPAETARLFADVYGRSLEPDVLADVVARTEGWAASLQLVQAALRDRTPSEIRRFVRGLSGADRELYDYLAEEVVGDLPEDLQQFLMRTSILQGVTADLASVVTELPPNESGRLTAVAERLTLLARPSRRDDAPRRYHPLVREFLEARLRLLTGDATVVRLHRLVAETAASIDWRLSAHHFREAGDLDRVANTVAAALTEIMGNGQYVAAGDLITRVPPEFRAAELNLVWSRIEMQRGALEPGMVLSKAVLDSVAPGSEASDHALLNLTTMHFHSGDVEKALDYADRLLATSANPDLRLIVETTILMIDSGTDGPIQPMCEAMLVLADRQRGSHPHYFGVAKLNLAIGAIVQSDPKRAIGHADEAIDALSETSSHVETSAALMTKAGALSMLGLHDLASIEIDHALGFQQTEATIERADLADSYGRPEDARSILDSVDDESRLNSVDRWLLKVQTSRYLSRRGQYEEAISVLQEVDPKGDGALIGQRTTRLGSLAYIAVAAGLTDCSALISQASRAARHQGIEFWRQITDLLRAFHESRADLSAVIRSIGATAPWSITFVADVLVRAIDDLDDSAVDAIVESARLHPGRWRFVLRGFVDGAAIGSAVKAAKVLESIGDRSDVRRLRAFARRNRRVAGASQLGRALARTLADKVFVEDQNRIGIIVGSRQIPGSAVRRKVLALLCFLLSRPGLASTRDQVLEALWPELDPPDAVNSLNQTVYFLRRVLEESYVDDLSPGYLHHDSELIWLDPQLVTSRSNECRSLIKGLPDMPAPNHVAELVATYKGRFALDFEYEEWSTPYRDWMHASFLEVVERALTGDIDTGHFERGISLARRVLDVDPGAEQVELSLLRLYRASGAHAAAAEQYGHYASVMRTELGVEPPPLEAL